MNHTGTAWREIAWLTFASALIVAGVIALHWGLKFPYANDSAGYIQEGLGLIEGRGLTRGAAWDDSQHTYAAFPLFPPGFSLAIAGGTLLGLSAPHAALLVSWLAWLLCAPAIAWATRPLVGIGSARAIALLAIASPGFVEWGFQALADTPMILASVLSLGFLTRAPEIAAVDVRSWGLSGFFAGLAYVFRNAGAVLPISVILLLGAAWLLRRLDFTTTLRSGLLWGGGFALCAFPLFAYNFSTFGSIQPYFAAHGSTDYGILHAARITLWSLLLDLSGWRSVADLAWNGKALLLLSPLAFFALWRLLRQYGSTLPFGGMALLVYSVVGCALIVWGRSHFDWVETTLTRQVMPYAWSLLALAGWSLARLAGQRAYALGWIIFVGLVAGRIQTLWIDHTRDLAIRDAVLQLGYAKTAQTHPTWVLTPRIKLDTANDAALIAALQALPQDALIVSNQAALLNVASGRLVRSFELESAGFERLRAPRMPRDRVVVALATNARLHQPDAARWQEELLAQLGDVTLLYRSPLALVVRLP